MMKHEEPNTQQNKTKLNLNKHFGIHKIGA